MTEDTNPIVDLFRTAIDQKLEGAPPLTGWLDGRIKNVGVGEIEMKFQVRPEMGNPTGLLHGGMQAAIMDDVIGMACATLGEEGFMLTIDLHTNFLGKAVVGERVLARARIVRNGRRIAHAVCELVAENGYVISRADANLVKTTHHWGLPKDRPAS